MMKNKNNELLKNGEYDVQKQQMNNEYRYVKQKWREAYYNKIEKQKTLIAHHGKVVDLSKKCRKMFELVNEYSKLTEKHRNDLLMGKEDNIISEEVLAKMEQEIKTANERRIREEKKYEEHITAQAKLIQDKEYEIKLVQLRLKEKEKELRLCELKTKEYKRQMRHNCLKPMPKSTRYELNALISPR